MIRNSPLAFSQTMCVTSGKLLRPTFSKLSTFYVSFFWTAIRVPKGWFWKDNVRLTMSVTPTDFSTRLTIKYEQTQICHPKKWRYLCLEGKAGLYPFCVSGNQCVKLEYYLPPLLGGWKSDRGTSFLISMFWIYIAPYYHRSQIPQSIHVRLTSPIPLVLQMRNYETEKLRTRSTISV